MLSAVAIPWEVAVQGFSIQRVERLVLAAKSVCHVVPAVIVSVDALVSAPSAANAIDGNSKTIAMSNLRSKDI